MRNFRRTVTCVAISLLAVVMAFQTVLLNTGLEEIAPQTIPAQTAAAAKSPAKAPVPAVAVQSQKNAGEAAAPVPAQQTEISAPIVTTATIATVEKKATTEAVSVAAKAAAETAPVSSAEDNEGLVSISPGLFYDPEKEVICGPNGRGMLYIGFDYDMKQGIFYTPLYPWQRNFGFTKLYDAFAPLTNLVHDTMRIKFEYGEYDWMVQLWKGRYGITTGAEIGVYHKPKGSSGNKLYDCASDENMLLMSFELLKDGEHYFSREEQYHWWLTGFVLGDLYSYKNLTLISTITFKDEGMRDAFLTALYTQGYTEGMNCSTEGLKVRFDW